MNLKEIGVQHLKKEYIFDGNELDLKNLFIFTDLSTEVIGLKEELTNGLKKFKTIISSDKPPDIEMSKHCNGCEFFDYCSREKPKHWIYYLPRISEKKWEQLVERGIEDIAKIPPDFNLSPGQTIIRNATATQSEYISSDLLKQLEQINYPLYFLDFETFNEPIPRYVGTRPYQQITFQWSCHILQQNGSIEHREFLHEDYTDPRSELIESLINCIGETGTIIHYTPFEKTRLRELAETFPSQSKQLLKLVDRLFDLCQVMRNHYYHPDFIGSYSIKKVLPVLVTNLSYSNLEIQEGGIASIEYLRMINPTT